MDLLGRKAKKELHEYAVIAARYVQFLDRKLKDITDHRDTLHGELLAAKLEIENLTPKPRPISSQPLYLSENQEDVEYAFKNELIDKEQYEDMLRQLDFDNSEITFDLESY